MQVRIRLNKKWFEAYWSARGGYPNWDQFPTFVEGWIRNEIEAWVLSDNKEVVVVVEAVDTESPASYWVSTEDDALETAARAAMRRLLEG